ncbi:MAG: response regulator [Polyangia bacterium]
MGTPDKVLGRAILATRSVLLRRLFQRLAARDLTLEIADIPSDLRALAQDVDLVFVHAGRAEHDACGALEDWVEAVRASASRAAPLIAFARDPWARSQALQRGAAGFLKVPCLAAEFWSLVRPWLAMAQRRPGAEEAPVQRPRRGATILLVDDSAVIHRFVQGALQGSGHTLIHASDGLAGLEAARRSVPELVITDVDMPHLDGYELCRRLRAEAPTRTVPILILSARGRGVDADRSQEVGATACLAKPVSEKDLLARIEQLLAAAGSAGAARPGERAPGRAQTANDDLPNPA